MRSRTCTSATISPSPDTGAEDPLRYAIAGGTGLIGRHLASSLRERGDEVWVLTRQRPTHAHEIQWDPVKGFNPSSLEGIDGVFDLVGEHLADRPWTKQRRRKLVDSRVQATETLLESLANLDQPPGVFVGVSSLGYFGDRGDGFVDDEDPPGTGFLADLCVEWERAQLSATETLGARTSLLRMSVVLAADGGAFPLMVRPFHYVGGWLGNGRQYSPWITIRDAVGALLHLADHDDCAGPFNGTVPTPITNKAWLKALGRVMHRPVGGIAPKWALKGAFGELAESLLLASIRAKPRKLLE
ncbi:MAG: TIGR01777 family oxidoreductase, partial [Myxococcota bacterium]